MANSEGTAGERAEQRRNRILAKRSVRMAYAAGDRSVAPRDAPEEEVVPPPIHHADLRGLAQRSDSLGSDDDDNFNTENRGFPRIDTPAIGVGDASRLSGRNSVLRAPRQSHELAPWVRTCFIICSALLLSLNILLSGPEKRPWSAVMVFVELELLLHASSLMRMLMRLVFGYTQSRAHGIVGAVALLTSGVSNAKKVYDDAVVFSFAFLVCLRVGRLVVDAA